MGIVTTLTGVIQWQGDNKKAEQYANIIEKSTNKLKELKKELKDLKKDTSIKEMSKQATEFEQRVRGVDFSKFRIKDRLREEQLVQDRYKAEQRVLVEKYQKEMSRATRARHRRRIREKYLPKFASLRAMRNQSLSNIRDIFETQGSNLQSDLWRQVGEKKESAEKAKKNRENRIKGIQEEIDVETKRKEEAKSQLKQQKKSHKESIAMLGAFTRALGVATAVVATARGAWDKTGKRVQNETERSFYSQTDASRLTKEANALRAMGFKGSTEEAQSAVARYYELAHETGAKGKAPKFGMAGVEILQGTTLEDALNQMAYVKKYGGFVQNTHLKNALKDFPELVPAIMNMAEGKASYSEAYKNAPAGATTQELLTSGRESTGRVQRRISAFNTPLGKDWIRATGGDPEAIRKFIPSTSPLGMPNPIMLDAMREANKNGSNGGNFTYQNSNTYILNERQMDRQLEKDNLEAKKFKGR